MSTVILKLRKENSEVYSPSPIPQGRWRMDVHQPSTSMPVPGCLQEVAATQPCPFSDVVPPLPLFSGTVPCRMVFTSPPPLNTCPNHLSILFLTMVRRSLDIVICSSPTSTSFRISDQTFFFKMAVKIRDESFYFFVQAVCQNYTADVNKTFNK